MNTEFELFPGKDLSGLFKDIYDNQQTKKLRISELITEIRKTIKHPNDVIIVGSILKDLVDTSVRNDESLLKLATIAQRIITATANADGGDLGILTAAEKSQLLADVDEVVRDLQKPESVTLDDLTHDVDDIKQKMLK